jgi:PAS domain S-box-containing protein
VAGQTIGVLNIQSPRLDGFCRNDVIAMEALTYQIAAAIENARLHEALQQELAERKQAEVALRAEKQLVDALMDSVPDSIYFKDRRSRLTRINRKMMQDLGLADMAEAIGKTDVELFGPEFGRQTLAEEQRVLKTGEPIVGLLESRQLADGRLNWTLTNKVPLRDADGRIIGLAGVTREVNDLKRAEAVLKKHSEQLEEMVEERTKELRIAQEQLLRREKLAVLGQLSGGLAHQLRNPLGNIKNATYLLKMNCSRPEPPVEESLEILETEINRANRIISSLLDFARTRAPNRVDVNLERLIQEVLAQVALPDAPPIELVVQFASDLPPVQADPDQLSQVFDNLLRNGIQAMPEGGRLAIMTGVVEAGWVAVSVADSGIGIPPADLSQIFEPLVTTKPRGLGLGLALIRNLVEANGGRIQVESEVGQGSTFTVWLPVDEPGESV